LEWIIIQSPYEIVHMTTSAPRAEFDDAPVGPLITGEEISHTAASRAYRPRGRPDWLVSYTLAGRGTFTAADRATPIEPGQLLVVQPGFAQDYGTDPTVAFWHNIWAHFTARGDMLAWLDWPTIGRGVMLLHLPDNVQPQVLTQLRQMQAFCRWNIGRHQELALNALERALLLADAANPGSAMARYDPRIRATIEFMMSRLTVPPSLSELAGFAGLSRSRFALLFEQQVGQPPARFMEQHRLLRVRQLLELTDHTLQELADEVGFSSPFYLSQRFKHAFGVSPMAYRQQQRRAGSGDL
jgi:AraC family transcriptional regulator of arabinose operon